LHELGILYHIVEKVQKVMADNALSEVEAIVLQVGEQSAIIPKYLHDCYPAAVDGTPLAQTSLEIEVIGGEGFFIKELRAR
jgi:hydrogenase nickel incorporation protein HypA/HybF